MKIITKGDVTKAPHLGIWRCPCGETIEIEPSDFKDISMVRGDMLWRISGCDTCGQNQHAWERVAGE